MADYRDFISFEVPEWAADGLKLHEKYTDEGLSGETEALTGAKLSTAEKAFQEMASTPEGAQMLLYAATKGEAGKISVFSMPKFYSATISHAPANIVFGGADTHIRYGADGKNAEFHNFTAQRLAVHETHHIIHGHSIGQDEKIGSELQIAQESQTVGVADAYMFYYYGEDNRVDPMIADGNGTPELDFNTNFLGPNTQAAIDMRERIAELPADVVATMSEHVGAYFQALYDATDNPDTFSFVLSEIARNDQFIEAEEILDTMVRPAGPEMPDVQQHEAIPESPPHSPDDPKVQDYGHSHDNHGQGGFIPGNKF